MFFLERENKWIRLFLYLVSAIFLIFRLNFVVFNYRIIFEWEIFSTVGKVFLFNFYMDWISTLFFRFVALISGSVLYFSGSYIPRDKRFRKFIFLVIIFVLRIFFIVFSLNLIRIILGWDGLGIISYILVVFYNNEKSSRAGILTVISNRVGDAALLLSIACFIEMSRWNYLILDVHLDLVISALIVLAAITKRAQIPFSAWLPAAMAAPTPVSALVHSSTLVTAGVYLLIRFRNLIQCFRILRLLIYLGVLTTLIASFRALFEPDLKKVVALSTLSQLGIIIRTLALGFRELAFIHLLTHAIFKALLFICRGKIIHSVGGYQDARKMGGEMYNLPITRIIIVLSSYALCGVPFLAGFYSKDLIIESGLIGDIFFVNYCLYILSVGLSTRYSFRLLFIRMVGFTNQNLYIRRDEEDWVILISKVFLLVISLVRGAFLLWVCTPSPWIVRLEIGFKWLSFISLLLGLVLGVWLCFWCTGGIWFSSRLRAIEIFIVIWNLPLIRGIKFRFGGITLSLGFSKLDLGWVELFGGFGFYNLLINKSSFLEGWKLNSIKNILIVFVLRLAFLEIWG